MLAAIARRCRRRDDDGAVLILALLVLMIFGLILAAQFGEGSANQKSTLFVRAHLDNVYAADAGIDAALQRIRQDNNFCAQPPTTYSLTFSGLTAGHDVGITCTVTTTGTSVPGAAGYAAVVLSTNGDGNNAALTTTNGGSEKVITGPLFLSGGTNLTHVLRMAEGDIDLASTGVANSNVVFDEGYNYRSNRPTPDVPHTLPSRCPLTDATCVQSPTGYAFVNAAYANCRLFLPGRYVTPPVIVSGKTSYFASGVYDFAFTGSTALQIKGSGTKVIAGKQRTSTDPVSPDPATDACALNDPAAADIVGSPSVSRVSGLGATFVFSGDSYIDMDSGGSLQIYPRFTSTSETQRMAIVALKDLVGNSGWATSTINTSGSLVSAKEILLPASGSTTTEVVGGVYYTPGQQLTVGATNNTVSRFLGGVVVDRLTVGETASAEFLELGIRQDTTTRVVKIVSTASPTSTDDASYGGKAVTSVAQVTVSTAAGRPVTVNSWRSNAPDSP